MGGSHDQMAKDCHRPRLQVLHAEVTDACRGSPAAAVRGLSGREDHEAACEVAASPPSEVGVARPRVASRVAAASACSTLRLNPRPRQSGATPSRATCTYRLWYVQSGITYKIGVC